MVLTVMVRSLSFLLPNYSFSELNVCLLLIWVVIKACVPSDSLGLVK